MSFRYTLTFGGILNGIVDFTCARLNLFFERGLVILQNAEMLYLRISKINSYKSTLELTELEERIPALENAY